MNTFVHPVVSDPAVNFLEALAQNAATAMNNLPGVPPIFSRRYLIRALEFVAKEDFGPELNFFSSATGPTTDPATDTFLARWGWVSGNGERINATGLYRYYVDGMAVPYYDADTINTLSPPTLHVILQNISATAKSAAGAGACRLTAWLEPMTAGW